MSYRKIRTVVEELTDLMEAKHRYLVFIRRLEDENTECDYLVCINEYGVITVIDDDIPDEVFCSEIKEIVRGNYSVTITIK